ncbi:MAG TPA: 4'-phosphopantetheinyl transferase superfamily protein [Pyrinomonadaceae bacterium]|nr:4'-phosphopantetheinyl transferase superfamily protein [Pyrinomonadaceae bacterium]
MEGREPNDSSWELPPPRPALPGEEVHVWRALLDAPEVRVRRLLELLAPDERERAARFHFERDRRRFTVARGLLRGILGGYLNSAPEALRFVYGAQGKPALVAEQNPGGLRFNVSHSEGVALFAFARGREVGVDVERVSSRVSCEEIAGRFFSPGEVARLRALPAELREAAFFDCWTRKEAYIKARGEGLSLPLDGFDVSLGPGEPTALLANRLDPAEVARWSLRALAPWPGVAAAVVAEGRGWRLKCWRLPEDEESPAP